MPCQEGVLHWLASSLHGCRRAVLTVLSCLLLDGFQPILDELLEKFGKVVVESHMKAAPGGARERMPLGRGATHCHSRCLCSTAATAPMSAFWSTWPASSGAGRIAHNLTSVGPSAAAWRTCSSSAAPVQVCPCLRPKKPSDMMHTVLFSGTAAYA